MPLIDRELAELENNAKCASFPKLTELMQKPFNLTIIKKEKPHYPISHSLTYYVESIRRPCFCFVEALIGLTDGLAMGGAESREEKVVVCFSK